jgi:DNA repair protein RadA/Sms
VARERSTYRCQACGFAAPKAGTCPDCARLGNFVAWVEERAAPSRAERPRLAAGARHMLIGAIAVATGSASPRGSANLIASSAVAWFPAPVLIGGDPGSAVHRLQASRSLADLAGPVLYVSGEESAAQVSCARTAPASPPRALLSPRPGDRGSRG